MSLTVALSKGKLLTGSEALFRRAGLPFPEGEGRKLVVALDGLRFLFVKDMDVPDLRRVRRGRLRDRGARRAARGRQRRLRAPRPGLRPLPSRRGAPRARRRAPLAPRPSAWPPSIPRVASAHFLERGVSVEVVKLSGSVELAPGLGLADCIVDVVETGRTLEENGLVPVEDVAPVVGAPHREPRELPRPPAGGLGAPRDAAEGLRDEDPSLRHDRHGVATLRPCPAEARRRRAWSARWLSILGDVRRNGDGALVRLTERFDGVRLTPATLRVPPAEVRAPRAPCGATRSSPRSARWPAASRPSTVASATGASACPLAGGGRLEEVVRPLEAVGLYVPGGAGAYPSSVLMNAIPARIAGVTRIVVVTPPRTLETNPAVAAALVIVGRRRRGLPRRGRPGRRRPRLRHPEAARRCAKIVGPGNAYVAAAKRQVRGVVEIDHDAGPSEVVVLADDTADAGWVAADLLAQAEHGSGDETVVLVTPSRALAAEVARLVALGLPSVANRTAARRALRRHGRDRARERPGGGDRGGERPGARARRGHDAAGRTLGEAGRGGRRLRGPIRAGRGRGLRHRAQPRPPDRRRGAPQLAPVGAGLRAAAERRHDDAGEPAPRGRRHRGRGAGRRVRRPRPERPDALRGRAGRRRKASGRVR